MFTWFYINVCLLNETSPNETSSLSSILSFLPFYYYFNDSVHFPIKFGVVLELEQAARQPESCRSTAYYTNLSIKL